MSLFRAEITPSLRLTRDVDVVPIGIPVLYHDGKIIEREFGEDSQFADEHLYFVDYVDAACSAALRLAGRTG